MVAARNFHEDYSRPDELKVGSDRSFGAVFTIVFAAIGLLPLRAGGEPRLWALIAAGAFLLAALAFPKALHPLNRLWMRFGLLLNAVMSPIIFGILFFLVITPFGIAMRLSGNDPMRKKRDPEADTYWIERTPPGPEPKSLRHQF